MKNHAEGRYFKQALSQFVHEFACGDEIRKYAGMGMSLKQIKERLTFPAPAEKIYETVWKYYLSTKRILLEEPGKEEMEKYEYVREISSYGKVSYRKVKAGKNEDKVCWTKKQWAPEDVVTLGGKDFSRTVYAELPFGLIRYKDEGIYQEMLACLSANQADFIDGLFQKRCKVYYRLDEQMKNILLNLNEKHLYEGSLFWTENMKEPGKKEAE